MERGGIDATARREGGDGIDGQRWHLELIDGA